MRPTGKPPHRNMTVRDTVLEQNRMDAHYAALSGKPAKYQQEVPVERAPRKASGNATEASILKAIMQLLKYHPKVAKVWRQNSGTFQMQYGDKTRYVRANTANGMADIMGILKDGRTLAIEVKSKTGHVHAHQQDFLEAIGAAGGLAFVARDVETVQRALDQL